MIRRTLHRLAEQAATGPSLLRAPVTPILERFAAGDQLDQAVATARELTDDGFRVSVERSTSLMHAAADPGSVIGDLRAAIGALADAGIGPACEVIVFPHAIGVSEDAERAAEQVRSLIADASPHGIDVMLGAGPIESVTATLDLARGIRDEGLPLSITLQASLRRTEADCAAFADGTVRLVKGAYHVSGGSVFTSAAEVDKSFVRCVKALLGTSAAISLATHDERLIRVVSALVAADPERHVELAFFLGRHTALQERALVYGWPVRVYVPFGPEWFTRLVDAFAERPATVVSALRSIVANA